MLMLLLPFLMPFSYIYIASKVVQLLPFVECIGMNFVAFLITIPEKRL